MSRCFLIVLVGAAGIGWLIVEIFLVVIFRYLLCIKQGDLRQFFLNTIMEQLRAILKFIMA